MPQASNPFQYFHHHFHLDQGGAQFGFITQDTQDGSVAAWRRLLAPDPEKRKTIGYRVLFEVEMFVLPFSCGGQIPPVGTRVTYTVVEEPKIPSEISLKHIRTQLDVSLFLSLSLIHVSVV